METLLSREFVRCADCKRECEENHVVKTDRYGLSYEHLQALAKGEICVIQVCGFANEAACNVIANGQAVLGFQPYINVSEVRKIGMAFYETELNSARLEDYFSTARENQNNFRRACEPFGSPLDTLRCLLDEVWPSGAHLQTILGHKMFIGLSRMVEPNTTFLAHHDIFADDAPGLAEAESLISQFAANIYFKVPGLGGELLMWHRNMSAAEFDEKRKGRYGIAIDELPPPDVTVKPVQGDLLIFDSHKIHAVASPRDCPRVAVSFFIGYRGDDLPLTYWS